MTNETIIDVQFGHFMNGYIDCKKIRCGMSNLGCGI